MLEWHQYIEIFTAIIVIVDPLGLLPIFISITADENERERAHTANIAVIFAAFVMIIGSLVGGPLLKFFGISMASFRVAGGLLILILAIAMLNAKISPSKQAPEEAKEAVEKENVAVVPLAVPLLAGPAALSTIIIYAQSIPGWGIRLYLILCIIAVAIITWIMLRLSIVISRRLGQTGLNNVTRLMGLILAAIAVEFIAGGLLLLFPGLK
ncbi:MAG: MarC family protein [candidate division Zixibacteria bacterium]|nr:MarC family protein [candidate division Zixibacteria bacterium]